MALGKDDAPANAKAETKTLSKDEAEQALEPVIDAGAGAPPGQREAAEALPEGDVVKDAIKESLLATDAQTEAKAKVKVVEDSSTGAEETPSGFALKEVAGIADDTKRADEYTRIKNAVRLGTVPATEADLKAKK